MEAPQALHKLATWLQEDICLVASESPGMAAEKAAIHDARLRAYKDAIFSLVTEYEVVSHLQRAESIDHLLDRSVLEKEAADALREYELGQASTQNAEQARSIMEDTVENFNQLTDLWQEVQNRRAQLLEEVQQVMDSHVEGLTPNARERGAAEVDAWKDTTDQLRAQRQTLREEIKALETETAELHGGEICAHLRAIDSSLANLAETTEERRLMEKELATFEAIFLQTHGIYAEGQPDNEKDLDGFLQEEIQTVAELYQVQAAMPTDIFQVEMRQLSPQTAEMVVSPRNGWMRLLRRGCSPILKSLSVTYHECSAYPQSIQVKVDLSAVPAAKADEIQTLLGAAIDAWKAQQMKQTSVELHDLVRIFFTKPPV